MNIAEASKAMSEGRLDRVRLFLNRHGFTPERESSGVWSIALCEKTCDYHHSIPPELFGLPVSTGWQTEIEALCDALDCFGMLCARQDKLIALHRESAAAWCHAEQTEKGWRIVSSTCIDDRVFSTRTELLENSQQFVEDERVRLAQKRIADTGLPEELRGLVPCESERDTVGLLREFMDKPNQGWAALCCPHAKTIACAALVAAATESEPGISVGAYVPVWEAILDYERFAGVLSNSSFVVLDMTTLVPAGTGTELGERITYLMQPTIDAFLRTRPGSLKTVIVSDFSAETLRRILGKQVLTRYAEILRFVDATGKGFTRNPFLK